MYQLGNYFNESPSFAGYCSDFSVKCQDCGRILIGGEGYYQRDGKPYCEDCVESADLEDFIRICETDKEELYRAVGLTHKFVSEDI